MKTTHDDRHDDRTSAAGPNEQPQEPTTTSLSKAETRSEIDAARDRIKSRIAKTVQNIIEIGRDLVDVKEKFDHGEFEPWVRSELGISPRMAQIFMNVADRLGGKSEIISHLQPTAVYALAAPSMPVDVRVRLLELAEKGEFITEKMVKEHREQAAPHRSIAVSEKDTPEPNSTTVSTPETKTDGAEHPSAHDRLRDACKAVLTEGGASDVIDIIRDLMPDPVIIMADVEVPYLLTELEARGQGAAEEGLLRLVRKWADTSGMEVIVKRKGPAITAGDSAPDAVAEIAAPDAVADPDASETDGDIGVDADTDAPNDEGANNPDPTPGVSPTDISENQPAEAEPETEPSEPTSTRRSDAPTAATLEKPVPGNEAREPGDDSDEDDLLKIPPFLNRRTEPEDKQAKSA